MNEEESRQYTLGRYLRAVGDEPTAVWPDRLAARILDSPKVLIRVLIEAGVLAEVSPEIRSDAGAGAVVAPALYVVPVPPHIHEWRVSALRGDVRFDTVELFCIGAGTGTCPDRRTVPNRVPIGVPF